MPASRLERRNPSQTSPSASRRGPRCWPRPRHRGQSMGRRRSRKEWNRKKRKTRGWQWSWKSQNGFNGAREKGNLRLGFLLLISGQTLQYSIVHHLIAEPVPAAVVRVMRAAHGIEMQGLHQSRIPQHGCITHGFARKSVVLVPVHSAHSNSPPVYAQHLQVQVEASKSQAVFVVGLVRIKKKQEGCTCTSRHS